METAMLVQGLRVGVVVAALGAIGILFLRLSWAERHASMLPGDVDHTLHTEAPSLNPFANPRAAGVWAVTIVLSIIYIASGIPKLGGVEIALRGKQEVDRISVLVDGAVQVSPLAADLDVGLVNPD